MKSYHTFKRDLKEYFHLIKSVLVIPGVAIIITACTSTPKQAVYEPTWESLKQCTPAPEWFRDAKFGIYFHWGVYSVPAYENEWYSHWMYVPDHPINHYHVETYGPVDEFGYKDFIPMFRAEKFNPDEWAELFKKAGARFAGPVTEHADGFAMWDSKLTSFDAADMGPNRDIVGEMEKAIRKQGMKFITTFHHSWLYAWYPTWDERTGVADPEYADLYGPIVPSTAWNYGNKPTDPMPDEDFCKRWHSRIIEVIDRYQPDLVYFDGKLDIIDSTFRLDFLSYYYNKAIEWGRDVVVTYKFEDLKPWVGVLDMERGRMKEKKEFPWLTDDSIDWGSWCHVQDPDYKTTNRLIDYLVDVVSKNGCVLLNITPTAEGEIPEPVKQRLLGMGEWLKINGEAIYSTRPWKVYGEGPTQLVEGHLSEHQNPDNTAEDIRFTVNNKIIYAICLDIPTSTSVNIHSLNDSNGIGPGSIVDVKILGDEQELTWEFTDSSFVIHFEEIPELDHGIAFRIETTDNQAPDQ